MNNETSLCMYMFRVGTYQSPRRNFRKQDYSQRAQSGRQPGERGEPKSEWEIGADSRRSHDHAGGLLSGGGTRRVGDDGHSDEVQDTGRKEGANS